MGHVDLRTPEEKAGAVAASFRAVGDPSPQATPISLSDLEERKACLENELVTAGRVAEQAKAAAERAGVDERSGHERAGGSTSAGSC